MDKIINRLTKNAREAIKHTQKISREEDLKKIDAIFLLKSILDQKGSLGKNIALSFQLDTAKVERDTKGAANKKSFETSVHEVVVKAFQLALISKNPFVGTEHLIYSFLSIPALGKKYLTAKQLQQASKGNKQKSLINQKNSSIPDFFQEINMLIDNFLSPQKDKQKKNSHIQNYCTNLNDAVNQKDNVLIGRKDELERISNILGRKIKNNPVLIGDPGVGKTAIVEGLALAINQGKAPYYLHNKKIMNLDLGSLIAGTTFRGEFEARLKEVLIEVKSDRNIILFIDEIHNLVGAGNAVGGMDAANLLKPALSRGEIQIIGATTYEEYRKYIEKDAALERRFQPIHIQEPNIDETISIIKGLRASYESYHNIEITDEAIIASANLAKRYLHDRFMPDSAIDLIDETSARIRSRISNQKIFQELRAKKQQLEKAATNKESLVINNQYEEAIKFRNQEKILEKELQQLGSKQKEYELNHPIKLTGEDIKLTISQINNIPLSLIANEKGSIVSAVKKNLSKELIGQKEVTESIHQVLLRQFSGVGNPSRPLGSFLFVGPTGVGKTLAAKILSRSLSPERKESLIQINMSEFMERHAVSRLLGAPAGYVGYDESGELSEKVRRNPYSVILFDEIEKADPNVLNILLQILEDGIITDAKGRAINFKNTIIILTSNIGTQELNQASQLGFEMTNKKKAENKQEQLITVVKEELRQQLSNELINRLDHILIFNPLSKKDLEKIIKNELAQLTTRVAEKSIALTISQSAINYLLERSTDPLQGARLVRRQIETHVEPLIAQKLLSNPEIKQLSIEAKDDRLKIK